MNVGWNYFSEKVKILLKWEFANLLNRAEKVREKFDHNLE
jgi:hypothetical protein